MRAMDDLRLGAALRALRLRAGLRQVDVAERAGVSQSLVSAIENGGCSSATVETLRRVFAAVGARCEGQVIWRGPALERIIDARHAVIIDASAIRLRRLKWEVLPEVTYSIYGERGSIDLLGGMVSRRVMVVEEIKSEIVRVDDTIRKLDEKVRLVTEQIGRDRLGWSPETVGRILVLPDTDRARRQVRAHAAVFDVALPARGAEVRAWLREPVGPMAGIMFVANISPDGRNAARPGIQRVRTNPRAGSRRECHRE